MPRNDDDFDDRPRRRREDDYDDDDFDDDRSWRQSHRGTLLLVLGILGIVLCGPLGIAAWVMGRKDLAAMRSGRMDPSGKDMTQIGYILGIIGTGLFAIQMLFVCLWIGVVGAAIGAGK